MRDADLRVLCVSNKWLKLFEVDVLDDSHKPAVARDSSTFSLRADKLRGLLCAVQLNEEFMLNVLTATSVCVLNEVACVKLVQGLIVVGNEVFLFFMDLIDYSLVIVEDVGRFYNKSTLFFERSVRVLKPREVVRGVLGRDGVLSVQTYHDGGHPGIYEEMKTNYYSQTTYLCELVNHVHLFFDELVPYKRQY